MRILTRYLLRSHLGPFFFALSVLTGLLLINTVARRFQELAGKGLDPWVIAEVFLLSIPYTLALTIPMSVLVAVLHVFSQLTGDNEVTALKASGVSLKRAMVPLIVVGALMTAGMIGFNDRILPEANYRLKTLLIDINRKSPTLILKERSINEIRTESPGANYYMQVARIEPTTNRLYDVVIYDLANRERDRTIYADSGRMAFNEAYTELYLTLHDGWIHEHELEQPDRFSRLFFDRQLLRIDGVGNELERTADGSYRGDREMTSAMLRAHVSRRRSEIVSRREEAKEQSIAAVEGVLAGPSDDAMARQRETTRARLSAADDRLARATADGLRGVQDQIRILELGANRYAVEYHKKYAIPFACIVFVLIGAPLAIRFPGGGVGMVIAFSLVIFSIYWMGLTAGEKLGDKGTVAPMIGMWIVNAIFLVLGILSMTRLGTETSTARGGGWDEIVFAVRQAFGRGLAAVRRKEPV